MAIRPPSSLPPYHCKAQTVCGHLMPTSLNYTYSLHKEEEKQEEREEGPESEEPDQGGRGGEWC